MCLTHLGGSMVKACISPNQAYMVLLKEAKMISDYRLISMVHSFFKLFTKVLARRLVPMLDQNVKPNKVHSSWVDCCMIILFGSVCRKIITQTELQKATSALLKIDIAEAFDTVGGPFLLDILTHFGFPIRWCDWLKASYYKPLARKCCSGRHICHSSGLLTSLGRQIKNWADKKSVFFSGWTRTQPALVYDQIYFHLTCVFLKYVLRHVLEKKILLKFWLNQR